MRKTLSALKDRIFSRGIDNRVEVKKRARPHKGLHRGQLKAMLRLDQNPVVAYK